MNPLFWDVFFEIHLTSCAKHWGYKPDHDGSPAFLFGSVAKKTVRKTTAQIPSGAPKRKGAFVMQRAELKEYHIKKPP